MIPFWGPHIITQGGAYTIYRRILARRICRQAFSEWFGTHVNAPTPQTRIWFLVVSTAIFRQP